MLTADVITTERTMAIDAIWHQSPFGHLLQACTTTAHGALRAVLPLDARGCLAWPNADPVTADAESERIISLAEGAGVVVRCP